MTHDFSTDVEIISRLDVVPTILEVVCRTTGMGFAAVARVTEDRWIACSVKDDIGFGLTPGGQLNVETTICHEISGHREIVAIDHVSEDQAYRGHHTPAMYGFLSYVSAPITLKDGNVLGTLCAIDPKPARVNTPEAKGMFMLFAELIAFHIDAQLKTESSAATLATSRADLALSAADLVDERATSELREQFIAVLGHDLRNPLASVDAGVKLLAKETLSDRGRGVLTLMDRSVRRMAGLIDDVLDFARGRLGDGIMVEMSKEVPLAPMLHQMIDELQGSNPERRILVELDEITTCHCDPARIGQLLSNLLANALTHGEAETPVRVRGVVDAGVIQLSVTNTGEPIPAAAMDGLFKPFVRGSARSSQQGLGLGLYIASEIAKAHGGTLEAKSSAKETTFTFRMPA